MKDRRKEEGEQARERRYRAAAQRPVPGVPAFQLGTGPAKVKPQGALHWPDACRFGARANGGLGRYAATLAEVTCGCCKDTLRRWGKL